MLIGSTLSDYDKIAWFGTCASLFLYVGQVIDHVSFVYGNK